MTKYNSIITIKPVMSDRKKPKKYSKMGYQQKELYVKEQLKELGQTAAYHGDFQGRGGDGMFDLQESEKKLQKAASNDYDRREALKYGVNSGDKRFKDLDASSGFNSMEALVNTDRAINKYGYNKLGHKNMSSDADMAAVSSSLFNKSRDKQAEDLKNAYTKDLNALRDDLETKTNKGDDDSDPQNFEHSDKVAGAKKRLNEYKVDLGENNIFGSNNENVAKADDQADAARSFMEGYKTNLKKTTNVEENKAANLNNAISAVASYRK